MAPSDSPVPSPPSAAPPPSSASAPNSNSDSAAVPVATPDYSAPSSAVALGSGVSDADEMSASERALATTPFSRLQIGVLLAAIFLGSLCAIAYQLIIGAVSSYLLGDSVYQFSITIGLFMFAMGVGSYLSKLIRGNLIGTFVGVEIALSVLGGISGGALFLAFPHYAWYMPMMIVLILGIGILSGLEVPLFTRILSHKQGLRESLASVFSLDYIGALVGAVSFPLLLLPHLGLFRTSFFIGTLNLVIAASIIVAYRAVIPRWRLMAVICAAAFVGMLGLMIYAERIAVFAEGRLFTDRIIFQTTTPYQRIVLTESNRTGELRMFLDGHIQFAARDEYRYHEALAHSALAPPGPRQRVLILGGGDGMAAREALKYPDVQRIDLIDIDPAITELCRQFPAIAALNENALDSPRVVVTNMDAFHYVRAAADNIFDRVIVDLPDPHNEALAKLYSVEFFRLLKRTMTADGYVSMQSSSPFFTPEVFWCIAATFEAAGFGTYSFQVPIPSFTGPWGFTVATANGVAPSVVEIPVPTRFFTAGVWAAGRELGRDIARPATIPINRITEPRIHLLYFEGIRR